LMREASQPLGGEQDVDREIVVEVFRKGFGRRRLEMRDVADRAFITAEAHEFAAEQIVAAQYSIGQPAAETPIEDGGDDLEGVVGARQGIDIVRRLHAM